MNFYAVLAGAALATASIGAQAQVLGGCVGGGVGGAVNGAVGGTANIDAGRAMDSATGQVRSLDEAARRSASEAADRLTRTKPEASVGVGARVSQTTRCYATDDLRQADPYDPVYRDGYYYCEQTGPGVAAGARVGAGR